jgi:hypothetical protein
MYREKTNKIYINSLFIFAFLQEEHEINSTLTDTALIENC